MQVVIIEENDKLEDLISLNLSTNLGINIVKRSQVQEVFDLIKILPEIDLVLCSSKYYQKISSYFTDEEVLIPILKTDELSWNKTLEKISETLSINLEVIKEKKLPDFFPINVSYFTNIESICCDVFIKIKKGNSFEYIKRLHQGDFFTKEEVFKYVQQGLKYFFISSEDVNSFRVYLSNELVKKLETQNFSTDQKIHILGDSFDFALKDIIEMGFDSASIQLTESIVDNMLSIFKGSEKVSPLLRNILNSKSSLIFQHSFLTSVVSNEILKNLKIDNEIEYQRMAYASFFKDMTLYEFDELVIVDNEEALNELKLDKEQEDQVLNHALQASIILRKLESVPKGVAKIVKHHHGSLDGKRFHDLNHEESLEDQVMIFIIAVEFVNELLRYKIQGGKPRPVIKTLQKRYQNKKTDTIIRALEKTLIAKVKK